MRKKLTSRILAIFALVFFLSLSSFAQEKTVTGIISDENGTPLPQATVSVKGTKRSAITDINGNFRISVPENTKTLTVSFVGMKDEEVSIEGKSILSITLKVADSKLNEVVVIGYGTAKRANVTSSIASISEKDFKNLPVSGADQALQGKLAGVTVTSNSGQPGGGVSVRVRGITSVNNNEPLYVVDGVPILTNTSSFNFSILGGGGGQSNNSVLATLNPNDIASIDVLKDASAQAIYGSLAANGVVLITTKKGRAGEGKINFDTYYGWQSIPKKLDIMNLRDFAKYQVGVQTQLNQTPTEEFDNPDVLGDGTNWQDAIFQTGHIQNHQLSFSGGQGKTTYYFSANYFNQEGILIQSKFKRYSLRANIEHQVKSWVKAGITLNASRSDQRLTLADEQDGTITQAMLLSPVIPIRNLDGTYGGQSAFGGVTYYTASNPLAQAENRKNTANQSKIFGSVYADFKITSSLNFRTEGNFDFQLTQNKAFQGAYASGTATFPSVLFQQMNNSFFWAWKNYLNFNKTFGKHNVTATVGHENWVSHYEYIQGNVINLNTNDQISLNNGTQQPVQGAPFESAQESYFARAGYTFNDKYSVSMSFRADASSNFGPNNRWGYFPAASVGWTVTNEKFAESWTSALSYLKFRVGAGAVGNQNAPGNAPSPPYTAGINNLITGFGPGNFPKNIANADLKWESVVTYNAGLDASIINRKIDITLDVYKKETRDMLLFSSVPGYVGLSNVLPPIVNAGQMTNTGIDLGITSYNITNKDFSWKTNFVFSHYKNKLDKLINEKSAIEGKIQYSTITVTRTMPGYPVGSFYGAFVDGLFSEADATGGLIPVQFGLGPATGPLAGGTWAGDIRFKDISGPDGKPDGKIDDKDITIIGSPHPKFTYGLTNTFSYKGFDLSIFVQGSYGAKIYNYLRRQLEGMENIYGNQLSTVLNRYSADNTTGTLPRFTSANKNNTTISDRFVEDGSYLRIQNISVGYNLPKNVIQRGGLSSARAYLSIQNLYTFTKYTGYDPEIGAFNKGIALMNIDNGHYPNPRSITVGLNVEF